MIVFYILYEVQLHVMMANVAYGSPHFYIVHNTLYIFLSSYKAFWTLEIKGYAFTFFDKLFSRELVATIAVKMEARYYRSRIREKKVNTECTFWN